MESVDHYTGLTKKKKKGRGAESGQEKIRENVLADRTWRGLCISQAYRKSKGQITWHDQTETFVGGRKASQTGLINAFERKTVKYVTNSSLNRDG